MISVSILQDVLNRLPPPHTVEQDYFRVVIRKTPNVTPPKGDQTCMEKENYFTFVKGRDGWYLESMPEQEQSK